MTISCRHITPEHPSYAEVVKTITPLDKIRKGLSSDTNTLYAEADTSPLYRRNETSSTINRGDK